METNSLTLPKPDGVLDRVLSRLLRFDLSRTDVIKWVGFTKKLLVLFLISIVSVAILLAVLSVQQARRLLDDSLSARGLAIAKAVARASFVPLMLEDKDVLSSLVNTYSTEDDLAYLRVKDATGRVLIQYESATLPKDKTLLHVAYPIFPLLDPGELAPVSSEPAGRVEVGMSSYRIVKTSRNIAAINIGVSMLMVVAVFLFGMRLIGNLTERMRDLVGEARLTEELKRSNKEMETFSYSVSHDLRSPLRSIDGFSQVLLEDYQNKLDDEGKDHLHRIRTASQRMAELIDAMLILSRLSRQELRRDKVNLSALVNDVAEELEKRSPERRVQWILADDLTVSGDPALMRTVVENLLGNAWKFTSRKEQARIEFGARGFENGKPIFYVKDNGTGFEMKYADKLFGVFQRLHVGKEFPGTGVGLATVQRILQRHGGRIWAEAVDGEGAVFYFTV